MWAPLALKGCSATLFPMTETMSYNWALTPSFCSIGEQRHDELFREMGHLSQDSPHAYGVVDVHGNWTALFSLSFSNMDLKLVDKALKQFVKAHHWDYGGLLDNFHVPYSFGKKTAMAVENLIPRVGEQYVSKSGNTFVIKAVHEGLFDGHGWGEGMIVATFDRSSGPLDIEYTDSEWEAALRRGQFFPSVPDVLPWDERGNDYFRSASAPGEDYKVAQKTAMAQRTGDPELDSLIEEFIAENPQVVGDPEVGGNHRSDLPVIPLEGLRQPEGASGRCGLIAHQFTGWLIQRGVKAWTTDSPGSPTPAIERGGHERDWHGYSDAPEYGALEDLSHCATAVERGDQTYLIDWSAAQYGYTEWPMVQRLPASDVDPNKDELKWERKWSSAPGEDTNGIKDWRNSEWGDTMPGTSFGYIGPQEEDLSSAPYGCLECGYVADNAQDASAHALTHVNEPRKPTRGPVPVIDTDNILAPHVHHIDETNKRMASGGPLPWLFDVAQDRIYTGQPGQRHDSIQAQTTPGATVEGAYQPDGHLVIRHDAQEPYTITRLLQLWYQMNPELVVKQIVKVGPEGKDYKIASAGTVRYNGGHDDRLARTNSSPQDLGGHRSLHATGEDRGLGSEPDGRREGSDIDPLRPGVQDGSLGSGSGGVGAPLRMRGDVQGADGSDPLLSELRGRVAAGSAGSPQPIDHALAAEAELSELDWQAISPAWGGPKIVEHLAPYGLTITRKNASGHYTAQWSDPMGNVHTFTVGSGAHGLQKDGERTIKTLRQCMAPGGACRHGFNWKAQVDALVDQSMSEFHDEQWPPVPGQSVTVDGVTMTVDSVEGGIADGYNEQGRFYIDIANRHLAKRQFTAPRRKHAMAERSGDPELDAFIEQFKAGHLHEDDYAWQPHENEDGSTRPMDMYAEPDYGYGMCSTLSKEFADFLTAKGVEAWVSEDVAEHEKHTPQFWGYDDHEDAAATHPAMHQEPPYPTHCVVIVIRPTGTFMVDWTASQYGYTEFPMVQRTDDRWDGHTPQRWQRKWSNILDPIKPTLSGDIFDHPESDAPTLKPDIAKWVKHLVHETLSKAGFPDPAKNVRLILTGSLCTFQFSEDSDFDLSLWTPPGMLDDESRMQLVKLVTSTLDGTQVPNSPHPLQVFVCDSNITRPKDLYRKGLRAAFSIDRMKWLVPPERELSTDVYRKWPALISDAKDVAQKLRDLLATDPDEAKAYFKEIHKQRRDDMIAGLGNLAQSNIRYKWIEHAGLAPEIERVTGIHIAKTAAPMAPDEWQRRLPFHSFFHATSIYVYDDIMRDGLRPRGETGEASCMAGPEGWDESILSRPGHVYLSTDLGLTIEAVEGDPDCLVLEIDGRQLDPALVDSDEDAGLGLSLPHWMDEPWDSGHVDGRAGWAEENSEWLDSEQVTPQAMDVSRSIAYRGTIPPSAISVAWAPAHMPDLAAKTAGWKKS